MDFPSLSTRAGGATFASAPYLTAVQSTGNVGSILQLNAVTNNYVFSNDIIRNVTASQIAGALKVLNEWDENGVFDITDSIVAHSIKNYVKAGNEITGGQSCSCGCG